MLLVKRDVLILALVVLLGSPVSLGQQLVNGSFETPSVASQPGFILGVYPGAEPAGFGWQVVMGDVELLGQGPVFDGQQWLDLDGVHAGAISQTLTTVSGRAYSLAFAYANNPAHPPAQARVDIADATTANDLIPATTITHGTATPSDYDWTLFGPVVFVAQGSATTVTITSLSAPNSAGGIFLDGVVVGEFQSPTAFCFPGNAGVISCPCANPSAGPGRGCDNGTHTGGAMLAGSGSASLSADTFTMSAIAETPTALTVFWTGTVPFAPSGIANGAGVRCVFDVDRLYTGSASGGSIARPGVADASVSARSAAVGAPITAGQTRYYYTAYRDPQSATACGNPSSTFNLSNAVGVTWGL